MPSSFSSSSRMKNDESGVKEKDSFKSQDGQKGSSMSSIEQLVYDAISYLTSAGKTIEPMKIAKLGTTALLLFSPLELVATTAMPPPLPPNPVTTQEKGDVPPYGASGCTYIPGRPGKICERHRK